MKSHTFTPLTSVLPLLLLLSFVACDSAERDVEDRFEGVEASAELEGVDLGKYDQANAITTWRLKEEGELVLLEGLNALGERTFGAVMEGEPQSPELSLQLIGETTCEAQLNLATMTLINTTCSAEQLKALEVPATQLIGTLSPLFESADKADGLFTKIACVGAGIGATVVALIVWQFASAVAVASASVSTTLPILTASGSVLGAVALCYTAFMPEGALSACLEGCDEDVACLEACVDEAKAEREGSEVGAEEMSAARAADALQCVEGCGDQEACGELCAEVISAE
jgi:hypothetical protein